MEALNKYFVDIVKNQYFDFTGRTSRRYFWMYVLFNVIIQIVVGIIVGVIASVLSAPILVTAITGLLGLALLLPSLGNAVRRLHDINKSGWWLLIGLIPLVGLVLIYFFVLEGDKSQNKFGAVPKN